MCGGGEPTREGLAGGLSLYEESLRRPLSPGWAAAAHSALVILDERNRQALPPARIRRMLSRGR
jgi:hypothetical protein